MEGSSEQSCPADEDGAQKDPTGRFSRPGGWMPEDVSPENCAEAEKHRQDGGRCAHIAVPFGRSAQPAYALK